MESFDAKAFLKTVPTQPGVYQMKDADAKVIYVGKAKSLYNRVSSYFRGNLGNTKTARMVEQIRDIEIIATHTEGEALLLENNLIKSLLPRYNILLRDDKSYPFIFLSVNEAFPRLSFHRGAHKQKGQYFGPYPSSAAVRETLNLIQKLFPIRQCEDSFFRNRSRPCLQYQIKRCTAPCVGLISTEEYANDVRHASLFLQGKDTQIIDELVIAMDAAAESLAYEKAALIRDQIAALQSVQAKQYVSGQKGDLDVVATHLERGVGCVQVFYIRGGRNLGSKQFYPKHLEDSTEQEMLSAFIEQYYLGAQLQGREIPQEILVSIEPIDTEWLLDVLSEVAGRKIKLTSHVRGDRARWVEMAIANAKLATQSRLSSKASMLTRFEALQEALGLDEAPKRIECFDVSHTMGVETVASCVVFDMDGPRKSDYRRYNINDITPGDDYAALAQVLNRRFTRLKRGEGQIPDIILMDGGKGQISRAAQVLQELQVSGVIIMGIAKGPSRKPGQETLFLSGQEMPFILSGDSPALHLVQQIDAEAHRFAITGHRQRRSKGQTSSILEEVQGLGPKRRQQLLKYFGGLQALEQAGVEDITRVPGISKELAQRIYDIFHFNERG